MTRVLVTGGGSGIGRAIAERFDAGGWEVWITDIDARLVAGAPGHWVTHLCDAADEDGMRAVFAAVAEAGGLGALCANAGTPGPTALIENVALEDWRRCVSVNLDGAFLAAKYAAPLMKCAGRGAMILTSSTAGQHGYPNRSPYAASKWAVIGLMKTLAMELGPHGIRANAICPGSVSGARMDGVLEREAAAKGMTRQQVYDGYAAGTSMRTWIEARDIGEMAYFLASDAARYVSGQVIAVDGHTENPDPKP